MKKLMLVWLIAAHSCILYAQGLNFEKKLSWIEIKKKAAKENKYIFMDCFATWCGPCKSMDSEVYPKEEVGEKVNSKFVSVKVQFDESLKDNSYVKSWRKEAKIIAKKYNVNSYPTYLFFDPCGELIYRGAGFLALKEFMNLIDTVSNPQTLKFLKCIKDFKNGNEDAFGVPKDLLDVINRLYELNIEEDLAKKLAQIYYSKYLVKVSKQEMLKPENLEFIRRNFGYVRLGDPYFMLFYEHPNEVDSVTKWPGQAMSFVDYYISEGEIIPMLSKDNMITDLTPNWSSILNSLKSKYPKVDSEMLILSTKIWYYEKIKNWKEYVKLKNEKRSLDPPKPSKQRSYSGPLNLEAWAIFRKCDDPDALLMALQWSEQSIALDLAAGLEYAHPAFYDTKANLLFKLGRLTEAIETEEKALEISGRMAVEQGKKTHEGPEYASFKETLTKMKMGEKTW